MAEKVAVDFNIEEMHPAIDMGEYKPSKGEIALEVAKIAVSSIVAGCAGTFTMCLLRPLIPTVLVLPETAPKAAHVAYRAIGEIGVIGIGGMVSTKVGDDVHETIDATQQVIQHYKRKSALKKLEAKEKKASKMAKYTEVKED